MTSLLLLAQELLERATNPAYGVVSNDEHAARLAEAIGPEDIDRFAAEVARLDDPATLTSYGWAWVLEFAIGHDVALDRALLAGLCQRWDEPALKALVIEAALDPDNPDRPNENDEAWLDEIISRAAPLPVRTDDRTDDGREIDIDDGEPPDLIDTSSAEALLTALLIVGTPPAVAAARKLLQRRWRGDEPLAGFVTARANDPDPLSRAPWAALQGQADDFG